MKNNKIIIILISLILIIGLGFLLLSNPSDKKDKQIQKETITPIMYEITKSGSNNKIYLFGSIHMANLNEFEFPKYVLDAYNKSNYIACEFDMIKYQEDTSQVMSDTMKLMYQDGTTIQNHINNETYTKLIDLLNKKKLYTSMYDYYKPYFFQSLLTLGMMKDANINSNTGIDNYFVKKAKEDNKQILEVESASYQYDLLLSFSDKLYELILSEIVDNYDEEINDLKELYKAWKKGDINKILEFSDDDIDIKNSYTSEQIKLIKEYNNKVINERNANMTNKLIEYFNNNYDVFYMVGTLHLIDENGIANLLKSKGYEVKLVN